MIRRLSRWLAASIVAAAAIALASSAPSAQQQVARPASGKTGTVGALPNADVVKAFIAAQTRKHWTAPPTPWGDPE